jgi:thioredoxin 1
MALPFIYNIENRENFVKSLETNPGLIIVKFGAAWCGPCKKIDPLVYGLMSQISTNKNITCAIIDIDENFEIYAFLKSKKMVNGVPVILCYKKGNITWIPDKAIVGADETEVKRFFEACVQLAN